MDGIFQVPAQPHRHLTILSRPGPMALLLGLELDQSGGLLINPLLNHAGKFFAVAVSQAPFILLRQKCNKSQMDVFLK